MTAAITQATQAEILTDRANDQGTAIRAHVAMLLPRGCAERRIRRALDEHHNVDVGHIRLDCDGSIDDPVADVTVTIPAPTHPTIVGTVLDVLEDDELVINTEVVV